MCTHSGPSPNPGSGHGMAEMVWSPWQQGRSWLSWDSLGSKGEKKPLNTKRLGKEKEVQGRDLETLSPQPPGSAHRSPTLTGTEAQSLS